MIVPKGCKWSKGRRTYKAGDNVPDNIIPKELKEKWGQAEQAPIKKDSKK